MTRLHALAAASALLLAACAAAPAQFYTLLPVADPAIAAPTAPYAISVAPVPVPAEVDQPQLLLRTGPQQVVSMEQQRWAAPLPDQLRAALAARIAGTLGTADVSGLNDTQQPVYRIEAELRRFESIYAQRVTVELAWRVERGEQALTCVGRSTQTVSEGYAALVAGHQAAIAAIADDIAGVVRSLAAGQAQAACPAH